ncbi:MAG: hypothetical protein GY724_00320 [Actinomycetia bacterium]|nr:hypothetical protein [Actinomycetes bacterium]
MTDSIEDSLATIADSDRMIFIDDLHHLDQGVIDQLLDWFSQLSGQPWQLVLAGRTSVHPMVRGARELAVRSIGPADLRLDDDEVAQAILLRAPGLPRPQLAALGRDIDGWAAGVDIASRGLGARGCVGRVGSLSGSDTDVADYFEREVLDGLSISDQDFLLLTSVLVEPSADACDELTGDKGSAERLARLGSLHAFLEPTQDGNAYRWVALGREFLLDRLRRLGPEPELTARRRVLRYYLSERRYDEVVAQAVETEDWYAIIDLIRETGLDIIGCGRSDDLIEWVCQLPPETIDAESGVAVTAAMALWMSHGDRVGEEIDYWLTRAARSQRGRPPCEAASTSGAIDAAQATFSRLGPRTRKLFAQRALRLEVGPETAWAALSHSAAGIASYLDDELRAARQALTESLRVQTGLEVEPRRWITRLFSPTVLAMLALIEIDGGGHHTRAEALISAAELQRAVNGTTAPGAGIVQLAKGRVAMAKGDRVGALKLALDSAQNGQLVAFQALGCLDAASILCEEGDAKESARWLAEADRLLTQTADAGRLLTKRRRAIERQIQMGRAARGGSTELLTERENEVLQLLDSDLSRREIAEQLYLSFETVKTYVQRLYQKLGVSSRQAAVTTARSWGWLEISEPPPSAAATTGA